MRKIAVFHCIEKLPTEEKKRAQNLYAILDKIEWLTIAPFYFGIFAILALPFLAVFMDGKLSGSDGTIFGGAALFYAAGVFFLKKIVFNPLRSGVVEQFRTIFSSDHNYRNTLETLKQLDPDMARNTKKYIAQAV